MGLRAGDAPEGRSAVRVYLGTTGEIARASTRASLLSLTPLTRMPALPDPPQHTQRRDPALTSTCRRVESQLPARDDGRSLAPRSHLCSLKGAQVGVMSGTKVPKAQEGCSCASRQSGDSHLEGRQWPQNTHIPRRLAWRAEHREKPAKAAACALCCCRRGERSQPRC